MDGQINSDTISQTRQELHDVGQLGIRYHGAIENWG